MKIRSNLSKHVFCGELGGISVEINSVSFSYTKDNIKSACKKHYSFLAF